MDNEDKPEKNDAYIWWVGGFFASLVIILWLVTPSIISWIIPISEDASAIRGQYGDMYGFINALFSGLAFVGVIVAILLQKEELQAQRKDLELTRNELKQQNSTLKIQRFENTFFSMLSLHNEIVSAIRVPGHHTFQTEDQVSREAFQTILSFCKSSFTQNPDSNLVRKTRTTIDSAFSRTFSDTIGHYFRNIYRIYIFIDKSEIDNKIFYAKILRAQFSDSELVVLFYNCYFYDAGEKFKAYAEKYQLFDNLPTSKLLEPSHGDAISRQSI